MSTFLSSILFIRPGLIFPLLPVPHVPSETGILAGQDVEDSISADHAATVASIIHPARAHILGSSAMPFR